MAEQFNRKHGDSCEDGVAIATRLYRTWIRLKRAHGEQLDPRWKDDYAAFREWIFTHIGPKPDGLRLARIDRQQPYGPGNLQWAAYSHSAEDRQRIGGQLRGQPWPAARRAAQDRQPGGQAA